MVINKKIIKDNRGRKKKFKIFDFYLSYYCMNSHDLSDGGVIVPLVFQSEQVVVFGKQKVFREYLKRFNKKDIHFYAKIVEENSRILAKYYYDKDCMEQLISSKGLYCVDVLSYKNGSFSLRRLDQSASRAPINDYLKHYYINRDIIDENGVVLPMVLKSKVTKILGVQKNFKPYLEDYDNYNVVFYPKLFKEDDVVFVKYYYDKECTKQLISSVGVYCVDILYELGGFLRLVRKNEYVNSIIKECFFNQKEIPVDGYDMPLAIVGPRINVLGYQRNFADCFRKNIFYKNKKNIYMRIVVENGSFLIKYYYNKERTKQIYGTYFSDKSDIVYIDNGELCLDYHTNYKIKLVDEFILNNIDRNLDAPLICPVRLDGFLNKILGVVKKFQYCFSDDIPVENISYYLALQKNTYGDIEIHYFYDKECTLPLKSRVFNKARIDIIYDGDLSKIFAKKKNFDDYELADLIASARGYNGYSYNDSLGDGINTVHQKAITSNKYSPEFMVFSADEYDDSSLKSKMESSFESTLFRLIYGETKDEQMYKYMNYIYEWKCGGDIEIPEVDEYHFKRLQQFFTMNYLEKDRYGYSDEIIARELGISLADIDDYKMQCDYVLYSGIFQEEIERAGLLVNTMGYYTQNQ